MKKQDVEEINKHKKISKKAAKISPKKIGLLAVTLITICLLAISGFGPIKTIFVSLQKFFDDNELIDGKEKIVNGDGTYKLSLSVTGEASSTPQITSKANVLVVFDVSGSMYNNANSSNAYKYTATTTNNNNTTYYGIVNNRYIELQRANNGRFYYNNWQTEYTGTRYTREADGKRGPKAEKVVRDFANALFDYNDITPDTVEMALITFSSNNHSTGAGTESNATWLISGTTNSNVWTSTRSNITNHLSSTGEASDRKLTYGGGTNWEAGMQRAKSVVNALPASRKNEPTYVIFVTDGAPTYRVTSVNNSNGSGNSSADDVTNYRQAMDEARDIQTLNDNTNFYAIYAFGDEADLLDDLVNYAYTGTDRTVGQDQMVWAGTTPTNNYYSASDTSSLQHAISDIFSSIIKTLGISEASIQDGTTNNVETTSGEISHL